MRIFLVGLIFMLSIPKMATAFAASLPVQSCQSEGLNSYMVNFYEWAPSPNPPPSSFAALVGQGYDHALAECRNWGRKGPADSVIGEIEAYCDGRFLQVGGRLFRIVLERLPQDPHLFQGWLMILKDSVGEGEQAEDETIPLHCQ